MHHRALVVALVRLIATHLRLLVGSNVAFPRTRKVCCMCVYTDVMGKVEEVSSTSLDKSFIVSQRSHTYLSH